MSNEAYLIANDSPAPACLDLEDDGDAGYELDDIIASAPYAVPVYWLALFDWSHLVTAEVEVGDEDEDEDDEDDGKKGTRTLAVPSLVTPRGDSLRLLAERRESLAECFPEFGPTWDRFVGVLEGLKSRYLKVDLTELWDLEPEDFLAELEAALRWFETRGDDDFDQLLGMASIQGYDGAKRTFPGKHEVPRAFHLRGYADDPKHWDNKAEL